MYGNTNLTLSSWMINSLTAWRWSSWQPRVMQSKTVLAISSLQVLWVRNQSPMSYHANNILWHEITLLTSMMKKVKGTHIRIHLRSPIRRAFLQVWGIGIDLSCWLIEAEWRIYVGKLTNLGSHNGLSPGRRQAILWTNAGILLIGPLGTNFSEILIEIQTFSLKKKRLKMSSAKCCSFCLGLNEFYRTYLSWIMPLTIIWRRSLIWPISENMSCQSYILIYDTYDNVKYVVPKLYDNIII